MVSPIEEGGLKEARDADNNVIVGESNPCNILPPQLNNMSVLYKLMCGCEYFISNKSMH